MRSSGIIWGVIILIIIIAGIWWLWAASNSSVATSTPTESATTSSTVTQIPQTVVLTTGTSTPLGMYLRATNKMTLYTFTKDTAASSTCYGTCAQKWPPLTASSSEGLTA